MTQFEALVLETLSFYEPMTESLIILDFSDERLLSFPNFDKADLESTIKSLEKKKLIKKITLDKEAAWIRLMPKRSWWKRLFPL